MGHFPDWVSVKKGSVTVTYDVGYYKYDDIDDPDERQYDIQISNGEESDEWFESVDEAEAWVRSRFS